jgi:hypothetical protein
MELRAHTAVAGMLELRGPQDIPSTELRETISQMQARGDQATAARLIALAAEGG